jgi:hypothetical protein
MRLSLPSANYRDPAAVRAFYSNLAERLNTLPGVRSAAIASGLPPERPINANDTMIENFVPVPGGPIQNIDYWNSVSGKFFETIGARIVEGRAINDNDGAEAPFVVVVNQTMAKTYWPKESAIGHRVRTNSNTPWRAIVGVVADVKNAALDRPAGTEVFFPAAQLPLRLSWVVVRSAGGPHGPRECGAQRDPHAGSRAADFEHWKHGRCPGHRALPPAFPDAAADHVLVALTGTGRPSESTE